MDINERNQASTDFSSLNHNSEDFTSTLVSHQYVKDVMMSNIICADATVPVHHAAQLMHEHRISSLLIKQDETLVGILTDRDLRAALANKLPAESTVASIMTAKPICIHAEQLLVQAQVTMMAHKIHHLPVIQQDADKHIPVGIITVSDIYRAHRNEPVALNKALNKAETLAILAEEAKAIPQLFIALAQQKMPAFHIGQMMSLLTDTLTKRLLELAQQIYGPAPCDFAWVVFGSQARHEQLLNSDQDSGLILADDVTAPNRDYFASLTTFVTEGLHTCGIARCPGGIMASNTQWQLTLSQWQQQFATWINERSPMDLLYSSIFFDVRHCAGNVRLSEILQQNILQQAQQNSIFIALMSQNAASHQPALGWFNQFILTKTEKGEKGLELKKYGTMPIVDIARVYCLKHRLNAIGTLERLRQVEKRGDISKGLVNNLIDAYEFISHLRVHHQVKQLQAALPVNNLLNPAEISSLKRAQLKYTFKHIRDAQSLLLATFAAGL